MNSPIIPYGKPRIIEPRKVPVTNVYLKDGRMATLRESISSIKHCKRGKLKMEFIFEGGKREILPAKFIQNIISSES